MTAPVDFEQNQGVGIITLTRPEAANTIDLPTALAFRDAVSAAAADDVRAILLVGSGPRFCAGGDVRSFRAADDPSTYLKDLATLMEAELRRLSEVTKPVVAGVHGAVAGAGLALMLNADLVVAGRSTRFLTAYAAVGLTPDCGVSYLLPRAVGMQRALDLALTGRVLSADEALEWGLVGEVVDDDAVRERAGELAVSLARGPAWALGQTRRLIRASAEDSRQGSADDEAATIAAALATPCSQQLLSEFLALGTHPTTRPGGPPP
jgi:2-(1,2-epoxy-1,2-dihydrophenyl)acetyl-CoA isomerase